MDRLVTEKYPLVLALAALLPMQLVLLRVGEPHGTTDQIGVLITIAQWFLLSVALAPSRRSGFSPSSVSG